MVHINHLVFPSRTEVVGGYKLSKETNVQGSECPRRIVVLMNNCPGDICLGDICSGNIYPGTFVLGTFVRGTFVLGGTFVRRTFVLGRTFVRRTFVLGT